MAMSQLINLNDKRIFLVSFPHDVQPYLSHTASFEIAAGYYHVCIFVIYNVSFEYLS
jgi:hypothetical protein